LTNVALDAMGSGEDPDMWLRSVLAGVDLKVLDLQLEQD
jgi:hypothetical protein